MEMVTMGREKPSNSSRWREPHRLARGESAKRGMPLSSLRSSSSSHMGERRRGREDLVQHAAQRLAVGGGCRAELQRQTAEGGEGQRHRLGRRSEERQRLVRLVLQTLRLQPQPPHLRQEGQQTRAVPHRPEGLGVEGQRIVDEVTRLEGGEASGQVGGLAELLEERDEGEDDVEDIGGDVQEGDGRTVTGRSARHWNETWQNRHESDEEKVNDWR